MDQYWSMVRMLNVIGLENNEAFHTVKAHFIKLLLLQSLYTEIHELYRLF
jgi:hypothetical protein